MDPAPPKPTSVPYRDFRFWLLLGFLFCFRLAYGLMSDFWKEDELQVYLLGLKFYTTGDWPYFGPDVFSGARPVVQIPGALQGLLVGGPFFVIPIPEAPFILLNLLSFAALGLLAWYATKRLPRLPPFEVWTWTMTVPWVLQLSTQVFNPSYVLFGSSLFFVGLMEACRPLRRGVMSPALASFLMGFGLAWIMQLHLSWVILVPYLFFPVVLYADDRTTTRSVGAASFVAGFAIPASLLLPTFAKYGIDYGSGGEQRALGLHLSNLSAFFTVLVRYVSFGTSALHRFLLTDESGWIPLLRHWPWLTPVVAVVALVGALQTPILIGSVFRRQHTESDWPAVKFLALFSFFLIYLSFVFATKRPKAHTFYVCFPVMFLYSLYCWSMFVGTKLWRVVVPVTLVAVIVAHASYALYARANRSLYATRDLVASAIQQRDYRILAERRVGARF